MQVDKAQKQNPNITVNKIFSNHVMFCNQNKGCKLRKDVAFLYILYPTRTMVDVEVVFIRDPGPEERCPRVEGVTEILHQGWQFGQVKR